MIRPDLLPLVRSLFPQQSDDAERGVMRVIAIGDVLFTLVPQRLIGGFVVVQS